MSDVRIGFGVAAVAAALYGVLLLQAPPGWRRALVKAAAAGALAIAARLGDAPPLLALALALSALGDAALAFDPRRTLQGGLTAFLLAHLAYLALFLEIGAAGRLFAEPWRLAGAVAAAGAGAGLVAYLWRALGALRAPVAAYAVAIAVMTGASLALPAGFWPAMLGAGLFMASDAILAVRLFRHEGRAHALADHAVWWLYAAAQGSIAWAFIRPWPL